MCAAATSASGGSVSSTSTGAPEPTASVNRPSPEQPIRCSPETAATTRVRTSTDATRDASTPSPNTDVPRVRAAQPPLAAQLGPLGVEEPDLRARPVRPAAAAAPAPRPSSAWPPARRPRARPRPRRRARRGARPGAPPCTAGRPSRCRRRASARRPRSARAPRRGGASRRTAGAGSPRCARARTRQRPPPGATRRPPEHRAREHRRAPSRRPPARPARAPARAFASTADSGTRPARTASTSAAPQGPPGPGISRSIPARAGASVSHAAHQSDITSPSKPHSSFSTSASSGLARHRHAVDPVVGGHDRPRPLLPHDRLERRQVELAQRPLPDPHVDRVALGLGVVRDEVLDRRPHAAGLQPAHVGAADPGGQQRILREALEVAPGERRPVQVHGRREEDVDALAPALPRQQRADPLDQPGVPRRRQRRRRRHVRRHVALVPALAAHAGGPVRHHHAPQPGRGQRVQRPHVRPREQEDLVLERERQYSRDVRHTVTQP